MQRFPVSFAAEFRGVSDAATYVDRESGEVKPRARQLKFERPVGEADVDVIMIAASQFDHVVPAFDWTSLSRGDEVVFHGEVVLQERGSRWEDGSARESYFTLKGGRVERLVAGATDALRPPTPKGSAVNGAAKV